MSAVIAPATGVGTYYLDSAEDTRREITEGDMIFIDMGIWLRGYLGDMIRAGIVGEENIEQRDLTPPGAGTNTSFTIPQLWSKFGRRSAAYSRR